MRPALSVIIPTYKRKDSLGKLLAILLRQEDINLEIIVVDQNPADYFDAGLKQLLSEVKWLKQEQPNASGARNRGFLSSTAPFVLFIDDDLIPATNFCRAGLDIFISFPEINAFVPLVYTDEGETVATNAARLKYRFALSGDSRVFSITVLMTCCLILQKLQKTRSFFCEC